MPKRSRSYETGLADRLKDREQALAYLHAAWEDSDEVFLLALRDVANAHGIAAVATAAGVNREHLYRGLSRKGNPTFSTLRGVLRALGVPFGPSCSIAPPKAAAMVTTTGSMIGSDTHQMAIESPCGDYQVTQENQTVQANPAAWLSQKLLDTDMEASLYCEG